MPDQVFSFLRDLKAHNNREWFQANKNRYEAAKTEVEHLVNQLIPEIARFDPSVQYITAKETLFRIFRDVRFSHNKEPYKTNFGAWITKSGRKGSGPGYYLHLEPGGSFLAGGIYMPPPDLLKSIRELIYGNLEEFEKIFNDKTFRKYFKGLTEEDRIKRPPKDFPADFKGIEWLKYKHYTVLCSFSDEQIIDSRFLTVAVQVYKTMYPLNSFLSKA